MRLLNFSGVSPSLSEFIRGELRKFNLSPQIEGVSHAFTHSVILSHFFSQNRPKRESFQYLEM